MKVALIVLVASCLIEVAQLSRLGLDIPLAGDVDRTYESRGCGFQGESKTALSVTSDTAR